MEPVYCWKKIDKPVEKFNQYLLKLYFKNSSEKINIKKIMLDYVLCVQDSEKDGLIWEDNSNAPVPVGLDIKFDKEVISNWTSHNEFFIQFKIYAVPDGLFATMMENKVKTCILFGLKLYNLSNVETSMEFKIWLSKDESSNIKVLNTSSNFV